MEVKSTVRQVTVYDTSTPGSYTLLMPHAQEPITVCAPSGYLAAKQLTSLFPDCEFIYEKDSSYVWESSLDRFVRDKVASPDALYNTGITLLQQAIFTNRTDISRALDDNREPDYLAAIDQIVNAFGIADKYFWILECRQGKPKANVPPQKTATPAPKVRPPQWPKPSSDYDGDRTNEIRNKDVCCKQQDPCCKQKPNSWTTTTLPFGVGYAFDGDINDIEKLTKELEGIFKGFRR